MKKLIQSLLLAIMFAGIFAFNNANAQVVVAGSGGAANGSYATLKLAFDALNLEAVQAGNNITVTINSAGYAAGAETAPCVLNQPLTSSWASLLITPIGAVTVSGAIAAGSPLIDLNGADNVSINGLNISGNSLTISNTTASATSGTSTIRMQTDATGNTVTNCSVLGSFSAAVATNGGNIYIGAGAVTTGNDNNTISNCNIGPAGANLPTKGIYGNGSTTTVALYNSNNTITGCNIFDYFGAAVTSAGIYLGGGNTDYTITNNKFYQTASRTQTTGAVHAGIYMASANIANNSITGNTIGYASNTGTGTYTFVGVSSSSRFVPIFLSTIGASPVSNVQGNTVTAISVSGAVSGTSTSAPFIGIYVGTGIANIGDITGNTVGSQTVSGSISYTSSSTSSGELYGIYYFPSSVCIISNNKVGGISGTNSSTGGFSIYGIRSFTASGVTNTMQNNTIGYSAAPITSSATGSTASRVVGLYSQTGASVLTGNTISNLNCASPNVGTGSSSSVLGIWSDNSSATIGNNISGNIIHSLSNSNATAAVWVTGMTYNGSTTAGTYNVQKNFVHSLNITSTSATATMNGIYIIGGIANYYNNMVRLGIDASGASVTAGAAINGISEQVAGTDNIYFNSVYIGGSAVAGSANTYAFVSTITTNTRNFRDNIFYNARSNGAGTGKHYAVRVGGTAPNPAGLTINNNVYYATGTGGVFGFFNSLDVANLASWKAVVGQDANSFESNPQYLTPNGTSATVNLHINPSVATNVESNGFDIVSITEDYDSQTRSGLTPVDIGADAGNFTPGSDLTGPAIVYTVLNNTTSTSSRTLTATITDASGVDQSAGNKPRIYYKKSTDPNDLASWKTTQVTTIVVDAYTFNVDYTLLSPVVAGDVIQYFVIAQDLAGTPNIGVNIAAFNTIPTSVNLIAGNYPATSTNSYIIVGAPLSGDYTIGVLDFNRAAGKNITFERVTKKVMKEVFVADATDNNKKSADVKESASQYSGSGKMVMQEVEEVSFVPMENGKEYTGDLFVKRTEHPELSGDAGAGVYGTITAAISDLNLRGVSGAVRFLLLDATYPSESYPIIVNPITGASGSNTVTLKPNTGVTSSVSGASASNAIFKITSSYFTIDGSNTVNGTTRDLTIENTSATSPITVWFGSNGTTTNNASGVKNCIVKNGTSASAIVLTDAVLTTTGGYFTNFTAQNNDVQRAYIGIYSFYIAVAGNGNGCVYRDNTINTSGANNVTFAGIYVQGADGALVTNNNIGNFDGTGSEDDKGVWFATGNINGTIEKNNIHDLVYTGTGGYGGHGIAVSTTIANANITISNNMISNMSGDGWSYTSIPTDNPIGINIFGSTGQTGIKVYYNSVNMYGNTLNQTSAMSMGIYLAAASNADIRNNSISNSQGLSAATGYGTACIYAVTSNSQFTNSNNNNYYNIATGSGLKYIGQIASTGSATLAAWKTATGQDVNSQSGDPKYLTATNLHVSTTTNSILNNNGGLGTGITTDIDGTARSLTKPDIGCDEFTGAYVIYLTAASQFCPNGLYTIKLYNSSLALVGTVSNVAITNTATNVSIVYNGIADLTGGYFSIKGVNTLLAWSNLSTISPSDASSITYNMTSAQSQEFSGNLQFNGVWSMIAGDVNQDEIVDASDQAAVENDLDCGTPGCGSGFPTDVNCDGDFVDASDLAIVENNQGFFVTNPPAANGENTYNNVKSSEARK